MKSNVEVVSTSLTIESLSNASLAILTALLDTSEIEEIELKSITDKIELRYAELEKEEQKEFIKALEALGVVVKIEQTVKITR